MDRRHFCKAWHTTERGIADANRFHATRRAAGGFLSTFFDVATERFTYVSCIGCGYTEFYNARLGTGTRVVDFLGS